MSITELSDRPAFQPVAQETEIEAKPLSRLALASFVTGILSLASFLASFFLWLAALAIVLGIVAGITILRQTELRGVWLARLGIGLGLVSVVGAIIFYQQREEYLYQAAGSHAETFLEYLTNDDKYYEALELLQLEPYRQITGTDLKTYYENATLRVGNKVDTFLKEEATQLVLDSKDAAEWKYQRGIRIWGTHGNRYIKVLMRNEAPGQGQSLHLTLRRRLGILSGEEAERTALWNVFEMKVP